MINEVMKIAEFMGTAFLHIWPYLIITLPLAVAVNMTGASKYIKKAFDRGPVAAIILATAVGAFSPFCSCGVIPVIAALLIGGVPLAPVMSFWIASPSMDPEIFFLSVGTIGWDLAVWRLAGTLFLSLAAGFITLYAVRSRWIPADFMRRAPNPVGRRTFDLALNGWSRLTGMVTLYLSAKTSPLFRPRAAACCSGGIMVYPTVQPLDAIGRAAVQVQPDTGNEPCRPDKEASFSRRLLRESIKATTMVVKFMALAFFLEALIILYVPAEFITGLVGRHNTWAILTSALLGIPVYTSSLSALPMISGLLEQGMSPAAALAFLIAGPTTTLPAMAAVWSLVNRKVFTLYVSFALGGSILLGYLKLLVG